MRELDESVCVKVSAKMRRELKEEARRLDIPVSDLIRLAIGNFLYDTE